MRASSLQIMMNLRAFLPSRVSRAFERLERVDRRLARGRTRVESTLLNRSVMELIWSFATFLSFFKVSAEVEVEIALVIVIVVGVVAVALLGVAIALHIDRT